MACQSSNKWHLDGLCCHWPRCKTSPSPCPVARSTLNGSLFPGAAVQKSCWSRMPGPLHSEQQPSPLIILPASLFPLLYVFGQEGAAWSVLDPAGQAVWTLQCVVVAESLEEGQLVREQDRTLSACSCRVVSCSGFMSMHQHSILGICWDTFRRKKRRMYNAGCKPLSTSWQEFQKSQVHWCETLFTCVLKTKTHMHTCVEGLRLLAYTLSSIPNDSQLPFLTSCPHLTFLHHRDHVTANKQILLLTRLCWGCWQTQEQIHEE